MVLSVLYIFFLSICATNNNAHFTLEYHEIQTKTQELNFINKYKNSKEVAIRAYVISLHIKHVKYLILPWQKLKVFNTYKNELDGLIYKHPKNIHLRYVRLLIQEKVPRFLNYFSDIEKDKSFLKKLITIKDSTDYLDKYIIKNTSL